MPITYKRNCSYCGQYYEGRGKHFCSDLCSRMAIRDKSRRKEIMAHKAKLEARFQNIKGVIKVVELPDIHYPSNIEMRPVFRFINDYQPDYIFFLGDAMDFQSISPWIENKKMPINGQDLKSEYEGFEENIIKKIREVSKAPIVWISGNHEAWVDIAIKENPNTRGYWEIYNNIDLEKYNILLLPFEISELVLGHLVMLHGKYTLEHHAKKMAYVYAPFNTVYCHTHDAQKYLKLTPVGNQPVMAESIGCLCHKNPHYKKGMPNDWINAFGVTEFWGRGFFNHQTIHIINGKFHKGVLYK